jgi:hypothetical protein
VSSSSTIIVQIPYNYKITADLKSLTATVKRKKKGSMSVKMTLPFLQNNQPPLEKKPLLKPKPQKTTNVHSNAIVMDL